MCCHARYSRNTFNQSINLYKLPGQWCKAENVTPVAFIFEDNETNLGNAMKHTSYFIDNLMILIESLAALGSGTRWSQKAQMGSNES